MKYESKAERIVTEIKAYLIRNDTQINAIISLKLELLRSTLIDYFNSEYQIQINGYTTEYNKGTSIGLNPICKLKNESQKLIIKLIKEIVPKDDIQESAEEFIKSLIS